MLKKLLSSFLPIYLPICSMITVRIHRKRPNHITSVRWLVATSHPLPSFWWTGHKSKKASIWKLRRLKQTKVRIADLVRVSFTDGPYNIRQASYLFEDPASLGSSQIEICSTGCRQLASNPTQRGSQRALITRCTVCKLGLFAAVCYQMEQ